MEIGSVAHKYYLLNIRLPVNEKKKINVGIGEIKDIRLVVSESPCSRWPVTLEHLLGTLVLERGHRRGPPSRSGHLRVCCLI